jgi:ParB family chromosome partitioning protein
MNAQSNVKPAVNQTIVKTMKLADLYLSELNPRQTTTPEDDQLMADSLAAIGLIHPVAGLIDKNGKVGIVAGGRRWRGLKLAVEKRPDLATVPVMVTTDKELALEWATTENIARKQLDVAEEIRAYGAMKEQGKSASEIARCFGRTEKHVYKLLKLANLPSEVLDALQNKEIGIDVAQAITTCGDENRILEGLSLAIERGWNGHQARHFFNQSAVTSKDYRARFVGLEAYKKAGGTLTEDLFNEEQIWHDVDILQETFEAKLTNVAEELRKSHGWKWVEVRDNRYLGWYELQEQFGSCGMERVEGELTPKQIERYDELAELAYEDDFTEENQQKLDSLQAILDGEFTDEQKELGGLVVYVNNSGEIGTYEGYVYKEDQKAAIEAGFLRKPHSTATKPKSDYSQAFVDDMKAIARGALQAKMIENPRLVLDLVAFSLSDMVGFDRPIGVSLNQPVTIPKADDGYTIPEAIQPNNPTTAELEYRVSQENRFETFMKLDQKERDMVLVNRFSRALGLSYDDDLFEVLAKETGAHQRQVWTPTETNCFKRLKGSLLDECFATVLGLDKNSSQVKDFEKLKKAEKAKSLHQLFNDKKHQKELKLSKKQLEDIATWVPSS